jgi:hypothetical protein
VSVSGLATTLSARSGPLVALVARESRSWLVARRTAAWLLVAPLAAVVLVGASAVSFSLFDWLTRENSALEWIQVGLLVTAAAAFVLTARSLLRDRAIAATFSYVAATLAVVFVAGEELSWGQSLLDWSTPAYFEDRNFQGETNIHNLDSVHRVNVYGQMLLGLYGTIACVAGAVANRHPTPVRALLAPPLFLATAFLVPFVYRATRLYVHPEDFVTRYTFQIVELSEVAELSLYFGVTTLAVLSWRLRRGTPASP